MCDILGIIRRRQSARGAFDITRRIPKEVQRLILEGAQRAPTPTNMQNFDVVVVDAKEQLDAIGKVPADMSEQFLGETYAQLSFSDAQLHEKKTGMLANSFPRHGPIRRHGTPNRTPDRSSRSWIGRLGRHRY